MAVVGKSEDIQQLSIFRLFPSVKQSVSTVDIITKHLFNWFHQVFPNTHLNYIQRDKDDWETK